MDWRGTKEQLSVHKFGGTSMASFEAMQNSAKIIAEIKSQCLIVVSAAAGVTRALMHLSNPHIARDEKKRLRLWIRTLHEGMTPAPIEALLQELDEPKSQDALLSLGEKLSSMIFTEVLRKQGIDAVCFAAGDVMKTTADFGAAEPLLPEIKAEAQKKLRPLLANKVVVTQGFIGKTLEGETTTLGKEASDYSCALFAEALNAHHFAIWSDLPGVFSADPKIVPDAKPIHSMSIDNALALTESGAKVLHPRTMLPALRANMPFFVGSSQGLSGGTWVLQKAEGIGHRVVAINLRANQILVTDFQGKETLLDDSLKDFRGESILAKADEQKLYAKVERDVALLAIVGNHVDQHQKLQKILQHFYTEDQGRVLPFSQSSHTVFVLVKEDLEQAKSLLCELHRELFA